MKNPETEAREKLMASLSKQLEGTKLVDYTPQQTQAHAEIVRMILEKRLQQGV